MHRASVAAVALALLLSGGGGPARAQITQEPVKPLPDPARFSRGLYADAELGSVFFLGNAHRALGFGTAFGARLGYDLLRWVALQAHVLGSTHETNLRSGAGSGELLQLYQGTAELKLSVPIRQIAIAAFGGLGFGHFSTNLLATSRLRLDRQTSLLYAGGLGLDYHTLTRHFSFGLQGTFVKVVELAVPGGVSVTAYARYTF